MAGIVIAAGFHALHAEEAFNIGPRSLYGTPPLTNYTGVPLVMRDAVQNLLTGTRLIAISPRIMGGSPAPDGIYPWMASIQVRGAPPRTGHFCGGAFVAPEWVMTAAHCVYKDAANKIQVFGGSAALDTGGAVYFVDRIITHEKWDAVENNNDVSLLHLDKRFPGRTIRAITPDEAGKFADPGALAIASGWGLTSEGGQVSNILRHVTVQIVSNPVCNGLASYAGAITDGMMCAGFAEGGKDSCQGDSGGPLIVSDAQGGYVQVGIVSFGEGCGRPNKYGVYTRLSVFQRWVAGKIGQTSGLVAAAQPPGLGAAQPTGPLAAAPSPPPAGDARALAVPSRRDRGPAPATVRFVPSGWGWKPAAPK